MPIKLLLGSILLFISHMAVCQNSNLEDYKFLLLSGKTHDLTFQDDIYIQREFANSEKEMIMALGEAFLDKKDFMKEVSLKAKAYFELGFNYRNWGDNKKTKFSLTASRASYTRFKNIRTSRN